jgi:hypothetical protein
VLTLDEVGFDESQSLDDLRFAAVGVRPEMLIWLADEESLGLGFSNPSVGVSNPGRNSHSFAVGRVAIGCFAQQLSLPPLDEVGKSHQVRGTPRITSRASRLF